MRVFYTTGYSAVGFNHFAFVALCGRLVDEIPKILEKHNAQAVAVRGSSGLSVAFGIRMVTGAIPFILCRKDGEKSHSDQLNAVGGEVACERYIILDDLICSGGTIDGIIADMGTATTCAAVITYAPYFKATKAQVLVSDVDHTCGFPVYKWTYD